MWIPGKKAELEQKIRDAERSIEEARAVRTEVARQLGVWDTIIARRAHDGLGVELELSFQRKNPEDDDQ